MKPLSIALVPLLAILSLQGEKRPQDPARKDPSKVPTLPPLDDTKPQSRPTRVADTPPKRGDLEQRFATTNPLLGVWQLVQAQRIGAVGNVRTTGHMIVTRSFVSLHLWRQGSLAGQQPSFQSSLRTYRIEGNRIVTASVHGVRNGTERGEVLVEREGLAESRRFLLLGEKTLRVYQDHRSYLEFTRVEELR